MVLRAPVHSHHCFNVVRVADDNGRTDGFTLFVPRDDAFWRLLVQDATVPDPFLTLPEFRLRTLLGHLVQERLFSKDMVVGATIPTTANKTLTVKDVSGE